MVVAHGNLIHSFHAIIQAIPITTDDAVLSVLPMSHMFERGAGILAPIGVGATVAFAERQIERWAADMAEVKPTLMATIPFFFERLEQRVLADLGPGWAIAGRCSGGRPGSAAATTRTTSPAGPTAHGSVFADGSRLARCSHHSGERLVDGCATSSPAARRSLSPPACSSSRSASRSWRATD